jgi:hypothetical protein
MSKVLSIEEVYPLADRVGYELLERLYRQVHDEARSTDEMRCVWALKRLRARWTGETRRPKATEWFLSSAVIQAYWAPHDLAISYPIARLVYAEDVTTVRCHELTY